MPQTPKLPRFLFEDCLDLLRGLVLLAWIGVAAGVAAEVWIRVFSQHEWPRLGGFSVTYNAVLLEFALNTLVLTVLLVQRDWYERVPRDSAHRLRWLLAAVLIWEGLHLFGAFHVTGSLQGPLLPLLPVLLTGAMMVLPGRSGWWLATYLLTGYLAVLLLEAGGQIHSRGLLADAFALGRPVTVLGLASLAVAMAAAVALGLMMRRWMYPDANVLSPANRVDHATGLFRRAFLEARMHAELGRTRRQGGEVGLVLLALEGQQSGAPAEVELSNLARVTLGMLRLESDTPARYESGILAVLLPATGGEAGLGRFAQRLISELPQALASRLRVAAVVTQGLDMDAAGLMRRADEALQRARAGGEAIIVTVGRAR